jgi:hypothetical protein
LLCTTPFLECHHSGDSLFHGFLKGCHKGSEYMQLLTTQDGCEGYRGSILSLEMGQLGQGLGKQALDMPDSFLLGAQGGAPCSSLLGHVCGSSLSPCKKASSDNPWLLQSCVS